LTQAQALRTLTNLRTGVRLWAASPIRSPMIFWTVSGSEILDLLEERGVEADRSVLPLHWPWWQMSGDGR
jgi:hypothetical protein